MKFADNLTMLQQDTRPLAPLLPFAPEVEQNLRILEGAPPYEKRLWLKGGLLSPLPNFIYRYLGHETSETFLSDYLVNSFFYLNSVAEFNDPFDMNSYVTVTNDWKKRRDKISKTLKALLPDLTWKQRQKRIDKIMGDPHQLQAIRAGYEKTRKDMGAICFTCEPRNLLMWSHYAHHHRGLALQFHLANDIRTMSGLMNVEYSCEYPFLDWGDYTTKDLQKALCRKHKEWGYEHELRIFISDGAKTYLAFQPEALTGLIFGCRADLALKEKVMNILDLRASKKLKPLKIYEAAKHPRKYKVTIQRDRSLDWPS